MKIEVIKDKNVDDYKSWPIWKCDPSTFDWTYTDEEHCYVLEGNVKVINKKSTKFIWIFEYFFKKKSSQIGCNINVIIFL